MNIDVFTGRSFQNVLAGNRAPPGWRNLRPRRDLNAYTGDSHMKHIPAVLGLSVVFLLLSAAIAANIGGHMPEMRGAWIAQALR
jgi:hypothetical protein